MVVKQVFDLSLRESGKRFISSLKASNRYSEGYLTSLETTVAMAALYAEEQRWPVVREISTDHIEDYLAYLQGRTRWFGTRENLVPKSCPKATSTLSTAASTDFSLGSWNAGTSRKIPCT